MDSGRLRRCTVALIAAYAIALQSLLSGMVPLAPSILAGTAAVLCTHDGADSTGQPSQHQLPCAAMCAALGHGMAGPLPPAVVVAVAGPYTVAADVAFSEWTPPRIHVRGPQTPRGPPLA
jgi:hypothetical protein